jgi:uncharacterized membrane protein
MTQVLANESIGVANSAVGIRTRVEAVDLLRGVVMVVMALDHVRDFFTEARFDPLDLTQTSPALFLTRWVTHFCAPVFVFLAGTGAFLSAIRGKTRPQLAWFLLTRGLWLVALEFTLVHLGWFFNFEYSLLLAQVIWAIGWSMVALAGLVFLPTWMIAALGVVLITGPNLLDGSWPDREAPFRWLWVVLVGGGPLELRPQTWFFVAYPILPWLGVMLAGYGFGAVWLIQGPQRRWCLVTLGVGLTLLFALLRSVNAFGDPIPWSLESSTQFTLLSFVNCSKYPPSLLFVLMTLAPAILLLAWWDGQTGWLGRLFVTFGRVPLFYYLLHIPLIHLVALVFAYCRYGEADFMFQNILVADPRSLPAGYGYGLPVVYLVWLGVVLLLYPGCRWFEGVKSRHRSAWLSYL